MLGFSRETKPMEIYIYKNYFINILTNWLMQLWELVGLHFEGQVVVGSRPNEC